MIFFVVFPKKKKRSQWLRSLNLPEHVDRSSKLHPELNQVFIDTSKLHALHPKYSQKTATFNFIKHITNIHDGLAAQILSKPKAKPKSNFIYNMKVMAWI